MPNKSGQAYGLTTLCPLLPSQDQTDSPTVIVRDFLNGIGTGEASPMAKVPNTYLCRFVILGDVFYEGKPAEVDHLQSDYLVFVCELHGDLTTYLQGMWVHAKDFVQTLWNQCVDFEGKVRDASAFAKYIRECQVETTFYFNGSNDEPLEEQLKGLYVKQRLSQFAYEHQGLPPEQLQNAFKKFIAEVRPSDPQPSWAPGQSSLDGKAVTS